MSDEKFISDGQEASEWTFGEEAAKAPTMDELLEILTEDDDATDASEDESADESTD